MPGIKESEIRQQITDQIVEALKDGGIPPWRMGWSVHPNGQGLPTNATTGRKYSGANPLVLQLAARRHGFQSKYWATFNQWKGLRCSVKPRPASVPPGKWGTAAILFKPVTRTEIDEDTGEEKERSFPLLRSFTLFNADQVVGAERWQVVDDPESEDFIDFEPAEAAIAATGADIRHGGDCALYHRPVEGADGDYIRLPHKHRFEGEKEYYSAALHELSHWSEVRLDWTGGYALGELRAEIASAYLLAELGVPQSDDLSSCKAYIAGWIKALEDDPRAIFTASTAASRAADFILSFSRVEVPEDQPIEALAC
jgi:antirestriction protein ArdC